MSEKRFTIHELCKYDEEQEKWIDCDRHCITDNERNINYDLLFDYVNLCKLLNEQQATIEELKTHNLQHFLEWLVIKGYVTDEPMKDINNVIDCVNKFKEYLTELDKITEINNEIGFDNDG